MKDIYIKDIARGKCGKELSMTFELVFLLNAAMGRLIGYNINKEEAEDLIYKLTGTKTLLDRPTHVKRLNCQLAKLFDYGLVEPDTLKEYFCHLFATQISCSQLYGYLFNYDNDLRLRIDGGFGDETLLCYILEMMRLTSNFVEGESDQIPVDQICAATDFLIQAIQEYENT